jgi:hypothetical protein
VRKRVGRALLIGGCIAAYAIVSNIVSIALYDDDAHPTLLRYFLDVPFVCIFWPVYFLLKSNPSDTELALRMAAAVPFWGCVFEVLVSLMKAIKRQRQVSN